jgi:hypothetical protein
MPKLYSYVVEHDYGLSPNPSGGFCTLAFCKFSMSGKRNVVELAKEDDWVIGTGGSGPLSAGHGRLVYAMRVTKKLTLQEYFRDPRFAHRAGNVLTSPVALTCSPGSPSTSSTSAHARRGLPSGT